MASQLPMWIQYVQALGPAAVALVIGVFAAVLGFRQWKTTWNKLRLDLYEKRFHVYEATKEFRQICVYGTPTTNPAMPKMHVAMDESRFLFGPDFHLKLQSLYEDFMDFEHRYRDGNESSEKEPVSAVLRRLEEKHNLEKLFGPYLSFAEIR